MIIIKIFFTSIIVVILSSMAIDISHGGRGTMNKWDYIFTALLVISCAVTIVCAFIIIWK